MNVYCKECRGDIEVDMNKILLTIPPKYRGRCTLCGKSQPLPISIVDEFITRTKHKLEEF